MAAHLERGGRERESCSTHPAACWAARQRYSETRVQDRAAPRPGPAARAIPAPWPRPAVCHPSHFHGLPAPLPSRPRLKASQTQRGPWLTAHCGVSYSLKNRILLLTVCRKSETQHTAPGNGIVEGQERHPRFCIAGSHGHVLELLSPRRLFRGSGPQRGPHAGGPTRQASCCGAETRGPRHWLRFSSSQPSEVSPWTAGGGIGTPWRYESQAGVSSLSLAPVF